MRINRILKHGTSQYNYGGPKSLEILDSMGNGDPVSSTTLKNNMSSINSQWEEDEEIKRIEDDSSSSSGEDEGKKSINSKDSQWDRV